MTARWDEVPSTDWIKLNAQLRGVIRTVTTDGRNAIRTENSSTLLGLLSPFTLVKVDTSGGNVTLTLPPASSVTGYEVKVKKMTAANTLTLDGDGSETIDGAATLAWTVQYQSFTVVSDGTAWSIV
jgi:hypothetical protein